MKLTQSSEMGIHAIWYLAMAAQEGPVLSSNVAKTISVSESYLIKVLKRLVEARLLGSRKGKNGGYFLRKEASEISPADIVAACEGTEAIYKCLKEDRECETEKSECPVCSTLTRASQAMYQELAKTFIDDLVEFALAKLSDKA